ncbi:hypothetical protein PAL_GLEAN10018261 [Pteropus alecto]|uniref:Uncharacterized protein n=1 Tax=Pteropus alecto TaxID=9402 RepID=L5JPH2_PTEAL|nr:hypothetical protein PAL_GLEAN10018261 [Pteropus alecto]
MSKIRLLGGPHVHCHPEAPSHYFTAHLLPLCQHHLPQMLTSSLRQGARERKGLPHLHILPQPKARESQTMPAAPDVPAFTLPLLGDRAGTEFCSPPSSSASPFLR